MSQLYEKPPTCESCKWWKRVTHSMAPQSSSYTFPEPAHDAPSPYGACNGAPPTRGHGGFPMWPLTHEGSVCGMHTTPTRAGA